MVVALLLTVAAPAAADHGGKAASGPADNTAQAVESISLTAYGKDAVWNGRYELDRSDINTSVGTSDIHVRDASYTNNWYGNSSCTDRNWTNGRCDHMSVKFNTRTMSGHSRAHWMSLGCHEFGHTADLGHRYRNTDTDNNSCMRDDIWPLDFDSHDINSINSSV